MFNNQKKDSYIIYKYPDYTKLDSCKKKQKRQNVQQHYEKHIIPVVKDDVMCKYYKNKGEEEDLFSITAVVNTHLQHIVPEAFVVDDNEIEEGNTCFDFEKEENFDETSDILIPLSFDNMPLYICFVTISVVIFHLIFLMKSSESILIEFCNTLLSLCNMSGALSLRINSLKHKAEFNISTDGMTVYIACS
ncbi:hypothetical protein PHYBLDRAFT_175131 [Phycomyces blakesleeanus NRRL 1555(-)]|uniref:C2H2-type zinc finger transcription factor n=1 Tax=Phycomyces blakesleeanus (strain ATCC 8743b / DSM 1359 / FGSC 10004 / NBRC 33097 / NRRL 1555) TaxID=763407 RepID=A0A162TEX2_PHYB8|nr:hypothetical protein PHYBLDRAFT_175131 [Phycomyces blakesleeanus NRRL 1555(-)]OAD66583.1 hypothetical protein PHYBLDRAFT_175131 [Phycomyces blakesleeanus NRRL 1555(-)]|eukprot:XP_018284623.1 hypothetical protein PHYBLDRAFT_175131 [Phycomyces blakesleeanus NRRL 1555(-)]